MKTIIFPLTNENIDKYVNMIRELGEANRADRKMTMATCLSLEEVLLNYQSHFGSEQTVELSVRKRFGELTVNLNLNGESYCPLEGNIISESGVLMQVIGLAPRYSFSYGLNRITLVLKCNKSKNELFAILLSVVLGIVIGTAGKYLPGNVLAPCHIFVTAVSNAIFGLMKMAAMPVIFLCVVLGIIGSGSVKIFRENGFRVLHKQILSMIVMLLFTTVVCVLVFGIKITTSSTNIALAKTLVETIFSIVPDNMVAPFVDGDNVKVIMLGVLFGCALLALEEKVSLVDRLIGQLKEACSLILSWVGKLVPVLIVVILTDNIWSGNFGADVLSLWQIAAVNLVVALAILVFMIFRVSREQKVSFKTVTSAVLTPGIKGVASGSTMLCYYDMIDGLTGKLKVPESKANFGVPLGIAFFQPAGLQLAIIVLFFAAKSGMNVDLSWMASFLLVTYVTSIATPPVSGGVVSLLAILFTTLGVTDPMTAMAFPLLMLLDYPGTGFRVMTMMLNVAKK